MKLIATALVLTCCTAAAAQDLQLPFGGRWFVMQGGDTPNVNQHMTQPAQAFGVDFAKVGGASQRQLAAGTPGKVEDFFSWGEPVLAPIDGEVVRAENGRPDNPLGTKDTSQPAGNHIVIRTAGGQFVFLAHMQKGSVSVKVGETVRRGQRVGLCGNSGNSDFPHIHLHVQDTPDLNAGRGLNPVFGPINVELTGRQFSQVVWPLIRGLFVSNP
ncbi:MAG: M23 family metallopeptidase [Acidobacteria bacterium]|nr:M23 family metallopeptidase [Acidobacteriota bacterium]